METLYRKVSVSEPSQFEHNKYYYFVDFDCNIQRDCFYNYASFDEYACRYKYFLVEIPETIKSDNTAVIEKLESDKAELLEALKYANRMLKNSKDAIYDENYIESLIQKHKQ